MQNHFAARMAATGLVLALLLAGCGAKPSAPKLTPEQATKAREESVQLITSRNYDDAAKKLQEVTVSSPKDAQAQYLLGIAFFNKKQYNEAIAAYKKALELNPKMAEAANNMGNVYRHGLKQVEEAEKSYRKAIEIDPLYSYAYTNLALLLTDLQKPDQTIEVLKSGIKAMPGDLSMQLLLAQTYEGSGRVAEAKATLEAILQNEPGYKPAAEALQRLNGK